MASFGVGGEFGVGGKYADPSPNPISPPSPRHLPAISPPSPHHLPTISPPSPHHLPAISVGMTTASASTCAYPLRRPGGLSILVNPNPNPNPNPLRRPGGLRGSGDPNPTHDSNPSPNSNPNPLTLTSALSLPLPLPRWVDEAELARKPKGNSWMARLGSNKNTKQPPSKPPPKGRAKGKKGAPEPKCAPPAAAATLTLTP